MIRGTTPTHVFRTDADLSDAEVVYVTYQQGSKKLEKTKENLTLLLLFIPSIFLSNCNSI